MILSIGSDDIQEVDVVKDGTYSIHDTVVTDKYTVEIADITYATPPKKMKIQEGKKLIKVEYELSNYSDEEISLEIVEDLYADGKKCVHKWRYDDTDVWTADIKKNESEKIFHYFTAPEESEIFMLNLNTTLHEEKLFTST